MSQYLDKDFLKFLLGFVAIIFISLIIIAVMKKYQDRGETPTLPSIQTAATTKP
jgi:hypothetical protein